ncbi:MAG: rod shape-determining protein MreD [Lachnospiraceae bacterium]|nr:rod shape-determining protein MreD [Lachnospiraceae bacterium]MDD6182875.1 rod shape-determining protein MreD [Lachnospiraceae bacterium]MDD7377819.1 rod shape-determining protein MreD [Lachnospiraceae bacterium]MDY4616120.1 rod shape-determining protein MreD [Lachnospiraceae bacterium]MDY5775672.1 rod shape-determining protein MreD [Lachnospiraceae bacterium]
MRRKVTIFFIIVICFLLQSTVFQALSFASISPNLLIVVVSSFGFMRGRKEGMWIGLFCGLLLDIFFGDVFGFYTIVYMVIGYINGMFRKIFYPDDIKLPMMLILGSDLVLGLIMYLLRFLPRKKVHFGYYLGHIIIPEMVYTLVITLGLYFILLKINQHLEKIEKRSAAKFV